MTEEKTANEICEDEVMAVLEKHGMAIDVAILVTPQGNKPLIQIVDKPKIEYKKGEETKEEKE